MEENTFTSTSIDHIIEMVKPYLTACSDLLGTLSYYKRKKDNHIVFYTDSSNECFLYSRHKPSEYYIFCSTIMTERRIKDIVNRIVQQNLEFITFSIVGTNIVEKYRTEFENAGYTPHAYGSYYIASSRPFYRSKTINYIEYTILPIDYHFVELQQEHATIINNCWAYSDSVNVCEGDAEAEIVCSGKPPQSESLSYIRYLISNFSSVGISYKGSLVCWMLTYDYGAIGILHTLEEYRRRGLAKKCMMKLLFLLELNNPNDVPPFSYIDVNNTESLLLHKQLGFEIGEDKMSWIQMMKT